MIKRFLLNLFRSENIIQIGIIIVCLLIVHNFVVALISQKALEERNEFIRERQSLISSIDQISTNVNLIDLGFRGYYLVPQENFKNPLEIAREQHKANMDTLLLKMNNLGYAHIDSLNMVDDWIGEYFALADQGVEFIRKGQGQEAVALFAGDPGYDLWDKYSKVQNSMRSHLNDLEAESISSYENITSYAFFSQLLLVCLGGSVMGVVMYRLIRSRRDIQELFERIRKSNREYVFHNGNNEDGRNNEAIIERMVQNLRHAAEFIQNITRGNLDVEWKGMDSSNRALNEQTLAGELISMRDQMVKVKEDEGNRIWISEGISTLSEVIRKNQDDMQEMSDKLIARIVKYTGANQGGLFFLDDSEEEEMLEMVSCFAYEKKKFVEKRVPKDVGLLGQAFLEGQTIHLKEIPENYIHITSGLGEAVPRTLILVPLVFNEEVVGVLELASIQPFTPIQLELLARISEIIASAIVTSKNGKKMQKLLEDATQRTEEMRAQEEEMRQNMEELQATQEELARKESELLDKIQDLEKGTARETVRR